MHDRARGPGNAGSVGRTRNHLLRRGSVRAETASGVGTRCGIAGIVSGDDPGAGDWIFAEFHAKEEENTGRRIGVNRDFLRELAAELCEMTQNGSTRALL